MKSPKLSVYRKFQLIVMVICILVAGEGKLFLMGVEVGVTRADNEAFTAHVYFAKRFQNEVRQPKADESVFAALNIKR